MAEIRTALVAGANGIIGKALMHELAASKGWRARALSRRLHGSKQAIAADLTDPDATRAALVPARDTTHLFYAALAPQPSLAEEDRVNGAMLRNLLDGLEAVGAPLKRVVLYQGAKVYGVHLGPVPAPFYEDENPRHIGPNFYFTQEDELRGRADRGGPAWSILRPDVVVGDAAGNAMNIAMVIGAYAALCRAEGAAFRFPGPAHVYEGVFAQVTDAGALGRASLWAATSDAAQRRGFQLRARAVPMAAGLGEDRRCVRLAARATDADCAWPTHMASKKPAWARLVTEQGLNDQPYERAVGWGFGDFVFHSDFDLVSDMGKIRRAGFADSVDSAEALIAAIRRLQQAKVLPL